MVENSAALAYTHTATLQKPKWFEEYFITSRETDVLSCLLHERTNKKIAIALDVNLRTVEKHIENVMKKCDVHSRERLLNLISHPEYASFLTTHYTHLLRTCAFNEILKKLKKSKLFEGVNYTVECSDDDLKNRLVADLKKIGATRTDRPNSTLVLLVLMPGDPFLEGRVEIRATDNYFNTFFEALFVLKNHPLIDQLKAQFEERLVSHDSSSSQPVSLFSSKRPQDSKSLWTWFKSMHYSSLTLLVVGCFVFPVVEESIAQSRSEGYIRSSLLIPVSEKLIQRPQLLKIISDRFGKGAPEDRKSIKTVVLLGMGGLGKTTLARTYARTQNIPVVWELRSESLSSLRHSFSKLAIALAGTQTERRMIEGIENGGDHVKALASLRDFVAQKLKEHSKKSFHARPHWLLIFDNVEDYSTIESVCPQDSNNWGQGHILITTRNDHITCRDSISKNNVIRITPLTADERAILFAKVCEGSLTTTRSNDCRYFLDQLPPFPLDIVIAAQYIKRTGMRYVDYLRHLKTTRSEFEICQNLFLKAMTTHDKTRYGIISSAIARTISIDPQFGPLLFIISLLGQNPIPKDLLIHYKGQLIVDRLIAELERYSLVSCANSKTNDAEKQNAEKTAIVFHASVHQNMLIYLQRKFTKAEQKMYLSSFLERVEEYCHRMMNPSVPIPHIRTRLPHLKALLLKEDLLTPLQMNTLKLYIGSLYCYLVDPVPAFSYLEGSLAYLRTYYAKKPHRRLCCALTCAGYAQRELGNQNEAQVLFEEGIKLLDSAKPSDPWYDTLTLARALRFLSRSYQLTAEYQKAKEVAERSLDLYKKYHKNENDMALALSDLATLYSHGFGDYKNALFYRLKAMVLLNKFYGVDHLNTLSVGLKLALDYQRSGQYKEALTLLKTNYESLKKNYPQQFEHLSMASTWLGETYRLFGDAEQADLHLKEGVAIDHQYFGENTIHVACSQIFLSQLYIDKGQYQQAKPLLEKALKSYQEKYGKTHDMLALVYHPLGVVYTCLKEYGQAATCFALTEPSLARHYGKENINYALFLKDLGVFYGLTHDYERAEATLNQAFVILEKAKHVERYRCFEALGDLFFNKSQTIKQADSALYTTYQTKAKDYYKKALAITQSALLPHSFHEKRIHLKLKVPL